MTGTQFWILTCSILLVGSLFFTEIFLGRLVHNDEHKLALLERVVEEGNGYSTHWEQLAVRTYQLSQQDPVLKEVLVRHQIKVNVASETTANPPRTGAASSSPTTSGSPAPNSTSK